MIYDLSLLALFATFLPFVAVLLLPSRTPTIAAEPTQPTTWDDVTIEFTAAQTRAILHGDAIAYRNAFPIR
jgi:hypothetical protein